MRKFLHAHASRQKKAWHDFSLAYVRKIRPMALGNAVRIPGWRSLPLRARPSMKGAVWSLRIVNSMFCQKTNVSTKFENAKAERGIQREAFSSREMRKHHQQIIDIHQSVAGQVGGA